MDVQGVVIWFAERCMCFFVEVEGNVEKVNDREFGFNCDFEFKAFEKGSYIFFHSFKLWSREVAVDP